MVLQYRLSAVFVDVATKMPRLLCFRDTQNHNHQLERNAIKNRPCHVYVCMYVCTYVCVYVCVCVCVCLRVRACVFSAGQR